MADKHKHRNNSRKVFVAMSGGVDSSVAALLLKKQGYRVVGVFMKPWQPKGFSCLWQEDREYALRTAAQLDIPLETWDFSGEYKLSVADYMIREYREGRTPNPDVMCNREIKFGLFLKRALAQGADLIATGHYARVRAGRLYKGLDKNKDQSYFLWTLTEPQLRRCLFPIGKYQKPEVRKLAKFYGLPSFAKPDSQGVCFVGELDVKDFLASQIKPQPGRVVDQEGNVLGQHDGVYFYTIGQRHGLNIESGGGPYYVVSKDLDSNTIVVGGEGDLATSKSRISRLSWINRSVKLPARFEVMVRYRSKPIKATLKPGGQVHFLTPVRAIAPGQSAVLYRNDRVVGGGILT